MKTLVVLLALLVCATPAAATTAQVDWLVTADRLFDGERMLSDAAVAIAGDRVVAVGPAARALSARRTRAFADATILPGLVDLHVHGIGCGQAASAVTTVRDLGSRIGLLPVPLRPRAPRVVAAGPFVGPPGGYPVPFLPELLKPVRSVAETRAAVRTLVRRGAGVIKVGLTPRNPNLTPAELRAVVAEAHAARVRVSAHVEDSRNVRAALAAGVDDFAHMPRERNPALLRKVARAGVEIVGTLHVGSGVRQAARLANARAFVGAGGTLLYGSDFGNPGIPQGVDREELRLMGQAGLSALDVLRNATSRAGRVLGSAKVGRLRARASADLVVVDGDVLRDITRVAAVPRLLLVRGAMVIDGTRFSPPAFGTC